MKKMLVTSLLLLCACSHTSAVRKRASFDLNCPKQEVTVEEAGEQYRASGCGRYFQYNCRTVEMHSFCTNVLNPVAVPTDEDAPSGATGRGAAENRAVTDLGCPENRIEIVKLEAGVYGAKGCGKRVAYACYQQFWRYWCKRDSNIQTDAH